MTIETQQPRGSLIVHLLKRIFLALFGYLVALVFGLLAIVVIYGVLSHVPGAPAYFTSMSMTPIALLYLPPLWLLVMMVALIATAVPAFFAIMAGEFLSLRSIWLNMLFGGAVALIGYVMLASETYLVGFEQALADFGVIVGAGFVAGFVYWLIAGRDAGFRRRA